MVIPLSCWRVVTVKCFSGTIRTDPLWHVRTVAMTYRTLFSGCKWKDGCINETEIRQHDCTHYVCRVFKKGQYRHSEMAVYSQGLFVCLVWFLFVWSFSSNQNFSLIWRRHHCRWRAANIDLCSALMAIEQWGFFSVPHLLWHGASVYNGHLRRPVTLTTND